jgi:nicotinate phosphoribosyltransferase
VSEGGGTRSDSARVPLSVGHDAQTALFVDLYELSMAEGYLAEGLAERTATFQLFARRLPPRWGYLVAAGVDQAADLLERYAFGAEAIERLASLELFDGRLLERLAGLRFTGVLRAMPEGTIVLPDEPVLEVSAPLIEAQLVETLLLNAVHFDALVTAKASRCVTAARGRGLAEFGARRAHGHDAAVRAARASYLAGFDSTSNVLAGLLHGIPVTGTMAHSFVQCFEHEEDAFRAFARAHPDGATLLVDTYDTLEGARRAARVATEMAQVGARVSGVRLDSGDLADLARRVRAILDEEGHPEIRIVASGGLDEDAIDELVGSGAPIDGFGVGSRLATVADWPALDMAYKLVALDGRPVLKLSEGKATVPCAKQVWRVEEDGVLARDVIARLDEPAPSPGAEPLLVELLRGGTRVRGGAVEAARSRLALQRASLAERALTLDAAPAAAVSWSPRLLDEQARARAHAGT